MIYSSRHRKAFWGRRLLRVNTSLQSVPLCECQQGAEPKLRRCNLRINIKKIKNIKKKKPVSEIIKSCFYLTQKPKINLNSYIWMTKSLGEGGSTPWLGCSCILAHKGEKSTSYPWVSTPQLPTGYAEVAGSTYSGMARIWTWLRAKKKGVKDRQQFVLLVNISSHTHQMLDSGAHFSMSVQ